MREHRADSSLRPEPLQKEERHLEIAVDPCASPSPSALGNYQIPPQLSPAEDGTQDFVMKRMKDVRQFDSMAALRALVIIALPAIGNAGCIGAYVLMSAWALGGPMRAVEALCLSAVVSLANPALFPAPDSVALLRWLVLFAAFGTALFSKRPQPWLWPPVLKAGVAFVAIIAMETLISSYAKDVSLSKLIIFLIGLTAAVLNVQLAKEEDQERLIRWMLTFGSVFVLASFPLLFTAVGFFANNHGFQGLLNQPQAYGVFLGPFTAWMIVRVYTSRSRGLFWCVVTTLCLVSLVATEARTGMLAVLIALPFAAIVGRISSEGHAFRSIIAAFFLIGGGAFVMGYAYDAVMPAIQSLAFKLNDADTFSGALMESRGLVIDKSMPNFYAHPIFGIGFGLPSSPWDLDVTRFMGIPIANPVEKGVIVLSVLEELGVVGFLGFALLVVVVVYRPLIWRSEQAVAITFAALATNAGEATLFSPGGVGMIVWIWIACGSCAPLRVEVQPHLSCRSAALIGSGSR
ncbi:MAG: O-antigen ligase domain-containing protein [Mesorhizobium sp.]|nr:MAG: O-antigen ligase domain-containing protein [Mesorhizobium sp.]TIW29868.1 MAG: O-antigen ligase family protein [Mesorhizobium sp.]